MTRLSLAVFVILTVCTTTLSLAGEPIDERRPAAPDGRISIENLSGSVTVEGWDREEVAVSGTLANDAEELEITGSETRIKIEVIFPDFSKKIHDADSDLKVNVPHKSWVRVSGVNTIIEISKVSGTLELESVNGEITVSGEPKAIEAQSVNGKIRVESSTSKVDAESVSGTVILLGVQGDVSASTVSGDIEVTGDEFETGDFSSVSGAIEFDGTPGETSSLDFDSHSGTVTLLLPEDLSAEFDVNTFSGGIDNEFGPEARSTSKYAPGKELNFTVGSGDARISVNTFSSTIRLMMK
jgi:DUF4097 and DUF4098 domain-containing protein YvlB